MSKMRRCKNKYCRKLITPASHMVYCGAHNAQLWKERHPINYHYNKLKYRAKERGHSFTLTLAKFTELWNQGLRENHGKNGASLSIDRIRTGEGYHDGNVRLLTLSENSRRKFVPYF